MSPSPAPVQVATRRSALVTALAWTVIAASALLLPISVISALMFVVGSEGTSNATLGGALFVIAGPPACLIAGIGLLFRKRWARWFLLAVFVYGLLINIAGIVRGPTPQRTTTSPSGVKTTTLASPANYSPPAMFFCVVGIVVLLLPPVRRQFAGASAGVPLDDEYEILDLPGSPPLNEAAAQQASSPQPFKPARSSNPSGRGNLPACILIVAILLGLAGGMGYLVQDGLRGGATYFPAKRPSQQRTVQRDTEPALFYVSLAVYSAIGLGSLGLVVWGIAVVYRSKRRE